MSLFCLSQPCLFIILLSLLGQKLRHKQNIVNKHECGLARKSHGNAVFETHKDDPNLKYVYILFSKRIFQTYFIS